MDHSPFDWTHHIIFRENHIDIKEESIEPTWALLSPLISPSRTLFSANNSLHPTSYRRRLSNPATRPTKQQFYSPVDCDVEDSGMVSAASPYGTWSQNGVRNGSSRLHTVSGRRPSDADDHSALSLGQNSYLNQNSYNPSSQIQPSSDSRPMSSGSNLTSSLSGAIGGPYSTAVSPETSWNAHNMQSLTIAMQNSAYPGVAGQSNLAFQSITSSDPSSAHFDEYPSSPRDISPESNSPSSPDYNHPLYHQFPLHSSSSTIARPYTSGYAVTPPTMSPSHAQAFETPLPPDTEIRQLRRRVRELELECNHARAALEVRNSFSSGSELMAPPLSTAFQASWRTRTDIRKRIFCSLNRAGNALCAWHDSRRERRAFPPRNAPPGYLNCGCTHEEALFEESLARHGVGSYHPGETVRMDPALRNPLLKLLEERYNYKDGDFERDLLKEDWMEGESPIAWEQKAQAGVVPRKRTDQHDRH